MRFLTVLNGNAEEFVGSELELGGKPRLPLPFALGGVFFDQGHTLIGWNTASKFDEHSLGIFTRIFSRHEKKLAIADCDYAFLWGGEALRSLSLSFFVPKLRGKIIFLAYEVPPHRGGWLKRVVRDAVFKLCCRNSASVLVMTGEQEATLKHDFGIDNVVKFTCGIDTQFYGAENIPDVEWDEHFSTLIGKLGQEPFVVMPGDELRINEDALEFVRRTGIRLVRVSQFESKSNISWLKEAVAREKLTDKLIILEKIDYLALRWLLRNASAYVGFVDSSWQPAGWTVVCEALASGLPCVIYDGITHKELKELGATNVHVTSVVPGDIKSFCDLTLNVIAQASEHRRREVRRFAREHLDMSITGPALVKKFSALRA